MKNKIILCFILFIGNILCDQSPIFLNEVYNTGFIKIRNDNDIFYWHFESRASPAKDPLVFWLEGGPGCSSLLALFSGNGIYEINDDLTLKPNPYSWNEYSNIVFVDQPVGTGYSKAASKQNQVKNEEEVANDFWEFLLQFYKQFPQYLNREMLIIGESYAGHYLAGIGAKIIKEKANFINFLGIAIGNGWVDPSSQIPEYATFAYENSLIGSIHYYFLEGVLHICSKIVSNQYLYPLNLLECGIGAGTLFLSQGKGFNQYDIRKKCQFSTLCHDFSKINQFLGKKEVQSLIGVQGRQWEVCKDDINDSLQKDSFTNMSSQISFILENNAEVIVYNGDKDFICNWRGGEKWTNNVAWEKQREFQQAKYSEFEIWGEVKNVKNLYFYKIFNSGHMVHFDQPQASFNLLKKHLKK